MSLSRGGVTVDQKKETPKKTYSETRWGRCRSDHQTSPFLTPVLLSESPRVPDSAPKPHSGMSFPVAVPPFHEPPFQRPCGPLALSCQFAEVTKMGFVVKNEIPCLVSMFERTSKKIRDVIRVCLIFGQRKDFI